MLGMKCLVTGCAGFIGSHLTDVLLAQYHEVVGIDAFVDTYPRADKLRNLKFAQKFETFRLVEDDLLTVDLDDLLDGVAVVFHLAGEPGVRQSWGEHFEAYTRNNLGATARLLEACARQPLQRFVFAGSSSVYGDAPDLPWREDTRPQPRSPYAVTKLAAEHLCRAFHLDFAVPAVMLRYFTVYGPRQRPDMAFHRFLRAILADQPIPLFGNGEQTRDFTFVGDIVAGTLAAAVADNAVGAVFNLGGGSRITLNDLLDVLGEIAPEPVTVKRLGEQAGDVRHTWADTAAAAEVLGYAPQTGIKAGLMQEFAWLQYIVSQESVSDE